VHGAMGLPTSSLSNVRSGVNPWMPNGDPFGARNWASVSMSCLELTLGLTSSTRPSTRLIRKGQLL
jgi:hypothetical protein